MAKETTKKESIARMNDALEKALIKLLKNQPFEKISLSQLVNEAGYSRGTFYNQYEDIYDFMNVMINNKISRFYESNDIFSKKRDAEQISDYTRAFAKYIDENRDFFSAVISDDIMRTQFLSIYAANVEHRRKQISRHSLPKDLPEKCISAFRVFWHAGIIETNKTLILSKSREETENIIAAVDYIGRKLFE